MASIIESMFSRRRTLVAVAVVLALAVGALISRGAGVVAQVAPSVTVDGMALTPGAREISPRPALGLLLPPGSGAAEFRASLDGHPVAVEAAPGRTARLDVGELPQGSHHHLDVWRAAIGPARVGDVGLDFQVTEPLQMAAAWLISSAQTTVQVSSSRELADVGPVADALSRAGASVHRDERGIEGRWQPGRPARFTVPARVRATTGAFLPADFAVSAGALGTLPSSRVDLSSPALPTPTGLRLQAYYITSPASRADLVRHARQVSVLSPTFYSAAADGRLVKAVDEQTLSIARDAGVEVMPLLTNQDFSGDNARRIFASPAAVDALTAALVTEAQARSYSGYQLDFEGLAFSDRDALSRFSQRLAERLRGAHLKYSTAVIPRKQPQATGLEQLFSHAGAYDYEALSRNATSMSLMAYDEHTSATDPGPVAGLDWVQRVVEASATGLDRSRLYLGVPLYHRDWPLRGAPSAGGYDEALSTAAAHDGTISWDFPSQSPFLRYSAPGDEHIVWMENRASLLAKAQVAKRMGFAGLAAWRLGLEDPGFWDLWPGR
ncbi:MAG: glycosyl hydrolase family 18 protein [Candidatus Dormibacteraeota bacterium]|nr:glycosyl hydrolase family 18 protein [Candidatus Dormibacteraeota bacterium]